MTLLLSELKFTFAVSILLHIFLIILLLNLSSIIFRNKPKRIIDVLLVEQTPLDSVLQQSEIIQKNELIEKIDEPIINQPKEQFIENKQINKVELLAKSIDEIVKTEVEPENDQIDNIQNILKLPDINNEELEIGQSLLTDIDINNQEVLITSEIDPLEKSENDINNAGKEEFAKYKALLLYQRTLINAVQRNWRPSIKLKNEQIVIFTYINNDGSIKKTEFKEKSSSVLLDTQALNSIVLAKPLPPLPDEIPPQKILVVPFVFKNESVQ